MGRFRFGLALVGALAFVLTACGGSDDSGSVNIPKARQEILRLANKVYGSQFRVANVRCPSDVPLEKGLIFFCTVDVDGQTLRINLTQTNSDGAVKIAQAQSVLVTQKVEDFVESYVSGKGKSPTAVTCGSTKVLVRTPGKRITCNVKYADGTTAVATLGVKDTTGNTPLLSVKPPP
jgi:hypothetical protein